MKYFRWKFSKGKRRVSHPSIRSKHSERSSLTLMVSWFSAVSQKKKKKKKDLDWKYIFLNDSHESKIRGRLIIAELNLHGKVRKY